MNERRPITLGYLCFDKQSRKIGAAQGQAEVEWYLSTTEDVASLSCDAGWRPCRVRTCTLRRGWWRRRGLSTACWWWASSGRSGSCSTTWRTCRGPGHVPPISSKGLYTDKKENKIFLIYKENGISAKSYKKKETNRKKEHFFSQHSAQGLTKC